MLNLLEVESEMMVNRGWDNNQERDRQMFQEYKIELDKRNTFQEMYCTVR